MLTCYSVDKNYTLNVYFIYSWTQHTSTKMNLSSETQDLFLECLGFARHITLEAPGIFCRIEVNLGPNSFKYETGECPPRRIPRWHSGRGRRTGLCSGPSSYIEPLLVHLAHLRTLSKSLLHILSLHLIAAVQDPGLNILLTIFLSWMEQGKRLRRFPPPPRAAKQTSTQ